MNILLVLILIVFLLSIFSGYKNGFLKTVFSLVSWIVVLVVCNYATPIVTDALIEKTDIEVIVQGAVEAKILEAFEQTLETSEISDLEAALPAELKEALLGEHESVSDAIFSSADVLDITPVVNGVVGILGFVITVIALRIVMVVVEVILGVVAKLPLIGPMDKLLGIVCGAGKGLIYCWVILAIVSVLALTGTNTEWAAYISQSQILTWLQDNNVLLNLIVGIK